jgi:hypothetical protein
MAEGDKAPTAQPMQVQPQDPQQPAQQPAALSSVPLRTNAVAEIIAHDHLKGMLNKTANKGVYKPYISKMVPRANHSPFGDFPKEFLLKKTKEEDFSIDVFEKSQAASASSI